MSNGMLLALMLVVSVGPSLPQQPAGELEDGKFGWKPALAQSGIFLGIQHAFRLATEPGTRAGLKGPFFRDYFRSAKALRGWGDLDPFLVNYVGHPMMGAVTGYIQIQNDPRYRTEQFGSSLDYWRSRMRAMGWSAAYAAQFELGPASEASLGNVGKLPGTMGVVDMVVTPLGGTAWLVGEDALDRYVISPLEGVSRNRLWRSVVRSVLNPDRSFANMLRWRVPWHRDYRPGVWLPARPG